MAIYTPTHLPRWTLAPSYFGAKWPEYYVFLGRNRDSDSLIAFKRSRNTQLGAN